MKLFCLSLIVYFGTYAHAQGWRGRSSCAEFEEDEAVKQICENAFARIDETVESTVQRSLGKSREKTFAKHYIQTCLRKLRQEGGVVALKASPKYVTNFADLSVTKARFYYAKPPKMADRAFNGNQRLNIFSRLVYEELLPALELGSTFPVANGALEGNKKAALQLLKTAVSIEDNARVVNWEKVEKNICGSKLNWQLGKANTIHEIFVASLIPAFTEKVLQDSKQGLEERINKAKNIDELAAKWERITEILKGTKIMIDRMDYSKYQLKDECMDDDTPSEPRDRKVFNKLAAMAMEIELMDDSGCPEDQQQSVAEAEQTNDDTGQFLLNNAPMFSSSFNFRGSNRLPYNGIEEDKGAPDERPSESRFFDPSRDALSGF